MAFQPQTFRRTLKEEEATNRFPDHDYNDDGKFTWNDHLYGLVFSNINEARYIHVPKTLVVDRLRKKCVTDPSLRESVRPFARTACLCRAYLERERTVVHAREVEAAEALPLCGWKDF